jgi:hypothetical protein
MAFSPLNNHTLFCSGCPAAALPNSGDEKDSMERLAELIKAFPQVVRPSVNAEAFLEDMGKASKRFEECFKRPW